MMELLTLTVLGLITGFVTGKLIKTTHGTPSDLILGLLGGFVGGTLPGTLGIVVTGPIMPFITPVVFAFVVIWILHTVKK